MSQWIKAGSTSGNQILYNEGVERNGFGVCITDGMLGAGVVNDGNLATVTSSFDQTDWVHVAIVFDNGALRLYVNGSEVASNPDVGYQSAGGGYWGGEIGTAEHSFSARIGGYFGDHVDATANNSAFLAEDVKPSIQNLAFTREAVAPADRTEFLNDNER